MAKRIMVRCGVLALSLLSGGCMTIGPDFERPDTVMRDEWLLQNKSALKRGEFKEWWNAFNDPVLNKLIEQAYRQNLTVQTVSVKIMEARAQLGIARGSLFPQTQQFGGSLNAVKLSESMPNFEVTDDPDYAQFQLGFDAVWEVDLWGRFRRGIESANAKLAVALADYDDALVSMTAEVAATYVQIREFQQRLRVAKMNEKIQQDSLHITEVRMEEGIGTELDMQQAKALLRGTRTLIATIETGLRQAKNALSALMGMYPHDLDALLEGAEKVPQIADKIAIGIPNDMLRRRPDVRRAEYNAAAQSAMIGVAKADLLPKFSLRGALGVNSSSANTVDLFDIFDMKSLAAAVGPSVSWPILNYGRIENNVRVQDARFEQALLIYKQTVLQAMREVEDALIAFEKAKTQVNDLQEGVEASNRAVELSLVQYRDGIEDYTRILNSQQFLVQQQDKLIQSQGQVAKNVIALYKGLGGGWEIREGKKILPKDVQERMQKRTDWGDMLAD